MESIVSEILENILSLLELEGSFDVEEKEEGVFVTIDTPTAGKLIGYQGETLAALQLLVNMIVSKRVHGEGKEDQGEEEKIKRVIIDVANWRKSKEDELVEKAKQWAQDVIDSNKSMTLPPMPSWQRRIIHMTLQDISGVNSESEGEGQDRHLVISPAQ